MANRLVYLVLVLSFLFLIEIVECNQQLGNSTQGGVVIPAMARKAGGKLRPEFTQPKKLTNSDTTTSTTAAEDSSEEGPPINQREDKPRPGCKNGYMPILNSSTGFRCVPKNCPYGRNMKTFFCDDSGYGTPRYSSLFSGSIQYNPPKAVYRSPRYQKPRRYWSRGKK